MIHHVYPGRSGFSLLAGKLNGNRSYMVEITKHKGSFHIIDGEKVSVRYRGQIKSCTRCHKQETECPGKGIARDCTYDRVFLSVHMEDHWKNIGYTPDTNTGSEVEEDLEVNIQIGKHGNMGPDLTLRYNSVLINGFLPGTDLNEIYQVLITQGLPPEILVTGLSRIEKAGKVTIENLAPETCLMMMEKMHGRVFLNRKVFVTSVVSASPKKQSQKPDSESGQETSIDSCSSAGTPGPVSDLSERSGSASQAPPDIKVDLHENLNSCSSDSSIDTDTKTPISPRIQKKVDLFTQDKDTLKRKSVSSPDSLTKKDKKKLKDQAKTARKHEDWQKKQVVVSP